jgi:Tfp pilus assembly protein PilZ
MVTPPPHRWRRTRQRVVLNIEYESASAFRASYLPDLPEGGIRIGTSMEVGQRILLNITFHGYGEPLQIGAVVRWSLPATHPDGPAAGLEFVEPSPEAVAWLTDVLDSSTQVYLLAVPPERVLILEVQPFLREVYSQEVRNWAELRDDGPVDVVAVDDPAAWLEDLGRTRTTLGVMDVDDLPRPGLELYHQVRGNRFSAELPLIVIGTPANVEPFEALSDDLLRPLRKPLRFGLLMNTVRVLAASQDV